MRTTIALGRATILIAAFLSLAIALAGCRSETAAKPEAETPIKTTSKDIRIDAGAPNPVTDSQGRLWQADTGFTGGQVVDRGPIPISNTPIPEIYRTEHYSMTAFSGPLPNGKYRVRLHFAETYDGITAKGQRVFDVDVEGTPIKGLDVFAEAGGASRALVKEIPVSITDGKLDITFTPVTQNPEINGIEIIPAK